MCQIEMKLFHRNINEEGKMTHSKQLCSKLISLLLALAMILALMPAVSLTASAAGAKYVLTADTPMYGSDGWAWDGQTLHFFGSGTYEVNSDYFSIESTKNGGDAVIDISGSITVSFTKHTSFFIDSPSCPLNIKGAGKITASTDTNSNKLFVSGCNITYAGGAICTDSDIALFISYPNDFTMTKGYIDAPNAYIEARSHTISNSYVAINSFNGSDKNGVVINIDKSYVDTQSILETDKERGLSITLTKSVMSSSAESSELGAVNDKQKPRFAEVTESVVYFPNMDNASALLGISGNDALKKLSYSGVKVAVGGVVFCDQLIENVSRVNDDLSGAFISLSNVSAFDMMNNKLTGGILISYKGQVITYNTNAEDATIVILSTNTIDDDSDKVGLLSDSSNDTFKSCTIVNRCVTEKSAKLRFVEAYVENCNIYTNTESRLTTSYNSLMYDIAQPNNYCVPNGEIIINDQGNNGGNRYANITSKYISGTFNSSSSLYLSPVICGNVCADIYKGDDVKFDGTDTYDVSIGKFVINGLSLFVNMTANAYEKQSDGTWEYLSIANEYTGSSDIPIYIGKPVFNVINNPTTYQDITTCKGYPASLDVELVFPYKDVLTATEFKLYKDNAEVDLETAGITAEVTGSGKKLTLNLTAGEDAAADRYTFTFSVNGQKIKGASGDYVAFTLTEYPFHTMEFGNDSSISWPYIDKDGNPKTFTGADYEKKIEADTWTWYGRSDRENGYGGSTLVLNDGFNFTTTADYGISKTKMTTFNIVVKGSCTVNAAVEAIHSEQNIVNINGADDNSTLSVNTGIVSDEALYISGVDIEANNVTSVIKAPAQIKPLLQSAEETFLYDCKITANDRWEGKEVINAPELKITRGVTLDLPACTIGAGLTYIAELESVDNILNGSAALTVEGSPYGEDNGAVMLKWIDYGMGMKLSTKPLEFIGTASDLIIADDTISADGDYCLFSGKEYRLDLSKLINVDISGCQISKDTTSGYSVKSQLVDGTQYFIVTGKNATDSTTNSTVTIIDSNRFYGSSMSLKLDVTLGRVVKADKVGFYHQGSYGEYSDPTNCYTASAAYNGKPLELQGTYPNAYYLVPSGGNIEVTLIPNDGFRFDKIAYGDDTSTKILNVSQDGKYIIRTDGTDKKLGLTISPTYDKQYCKVDISSELRKSLANGEIEAITLKYPDGMVKTLDGTLDEFPAYVLRNNEVTVSITPLTKSVLSINGAMPAFDSKTGAYSAELNVGNDTEITAELENLADLCSYYHIVSNADDNLIVTPAPINSLGQYKIGTEIEIFASYTEDKFINDATFNGVEIEPYKQGNGGYYYKVTTAAGRNRFVIWYTDLSTLNIKKPEHGSVEFSGRLDYGRSFTTLADGTQVYSIGTTDTVTLTITPDNGYRLKSVKLDGNKAPEVTAENGVCTFMMEQSVDWAFTAEFEEIPADSATVTVKCGANGTVTPATSDYPIGTEVTLTVTPDKGYQVKSAALDGKDVKLTDGKYTFTLTADCEFSVEFQKKPTGGSSSGGHSYTGSGSTGNRESVPALNGESRSWNEISSDLSKMDENSRADVYMNGSTSIPSTVLKEIKDKKISVVFRFDSNKSWTVDGSMITSDYASADLYLLPGTSTEKGARGSAGYRFSTGGNDVGAVLNIQFKNEYVGKFANLYFIKDGKAEFAGTSRVDENGYAAMPGASAKGEYVVMLCDYSDLPGDVNNDGVLNVLDASAILNDIIGNTKCANALMGDFNIDGHISAKDASAILIHIVS